MTTAEEGSDEAEAALDRLNQARPKMCDHSIIALTSVQCRFMRD